ncbi:MAG: 3-deoxy-D-manno-octulosonic acid transferase, partial [Verrucomicrobia bacterium]|nr:3-deoxy-D-manno-octulosonic acid transferase [Verrucomicrobiota bacterium]
MRSIYNILFTLVFWAASPWLLARLRRRGRWREGFGQRFGNYAPGLIPPKPPGKRRLWLHAVSVGEVNTCLQFLTELRRRLPEVDLFVSATTTTGMAELRSKRPADVTPIYFPIDRRKFVRRAIDTIRPDAVILVEREIWPTFLWTL